MKESPIVDSYPLALPDGECDGAVVHCSDPDYQDGFGQFVRDHLDMKKPAVIAVPGGIHDCITPTQTGGSRTLLSMIRFLVQKRGLKRLVLIGHESCHWYCQHGSGDFSQDDRMKMHLLTMLSQAAQLFPGVTVELYVAKIEVLEDQRQVTFRAISE